MDQALCPLQAARSGAPHRVRMRLCLSKEDWLNIQPALHHGRFSFVELNMAMIRVAIVTAEGKILKPNELSTADELQQAVEQARNLIRDCERQAVSKMPPQAARKVPYS